MMSEDIENCGPITRGMIDRLSLGLMELEEKDRLGELDSDALKIEGQLVALAGAVTGAIASLEIKLNKLIELSGYDIE